MENFYIEYMIFLPHQSFHIKVKNLWFLKPFKFPSKPSISFTSKVLSPKLPEIPTNTYNTTQNDDSLIFVFSDTSVTLHQVHFSLSFQGIFHNKRTKNRRKKPFLTSIKTLLLMMPMGKWKYDPINYSHNTRNTLIIIVQEDGEKNETFLVLHLVKGNKIYFLVSCHKEIIWREFLDLHLPKEQNLSICLSSCWQFNEKYHRIYEASEEEKKYCLSSIRFYFVWRPHILSSIIFSNLLFSFVLKLFYLLGRSSSSKNPMCTNRTTINKKVMVNRWISNSKQIHFFMVLRNGFFLTNCCSDVVNFSVFLLLSRKTFIFPPPLF